MNPKKSTEWVKTFGLDSVTVYKGKPYFFLFADIDTKDTEKLLKVFRKTFRILKKLGRFEHRLPKNVRLLHFHIQNFNLREHP